MPRILCIEHTPRRTSIKSGGGYGRCETILQASLTAQVYKAGSFGLLPLNAQCDAHATADAQRRQPLFRVATTHFVEQGCQHARA